jgi:hypothetical protein
MPPCGRRWLVARDRGLDGRARGAGAFSRAQIGQLASKRLWRQNSGIAAGLS